MLHHSPERDVAQRLPFQVEFVDDTRERRSHHVLVGTVAINRMRPTKRDSRSSDYGDRYRSTIVQHVFLRKLVRLLCAVTLHENKIHWPHVEDAKLARGDS